MISLAGLNDKQREAAETIEGPVLILAGAGSGKTRTLTYRIAHMVDNLGIPPKNILAVSFTNKAAKEMRERVQALLSKRQTKGMTLATFHSLGLKILKKEIEKLGYHKNFSIYDTSDQLAILRDALKHYNADKSFKREDLLSKIGNLKNAGITADDYADSSFFDDEDPYCHATLYCYEYYQDKLKFYNAIDFDDILLLTVRLFDENPDIAKEYSEQFQYIMIDEYQDTNTLQFNLVLHLTCTHNNLCVVGDDDQAIYSFRGADITNILSFEKNFQGAKVVKLEQNYRSISPILQLANRVIKENKNRRDKSLWSEWKSDFKPLLWKMADTDHEAAVVVEEIVKHQSKGGHLGDIAILYRSNTQVQPFEDELRLSQVPYTIVGGQKLYEKKEVKDLMAYLFVILNPKDQMSLRRILNVPNRGIGNRTLEKFLEKMEQEEITLYEALRRFPDVDPNRKQYIKDFTDLIDEFKETFKRHSLSESISLLVEKLHYFEYIAKNYDSLKQIDRRKNDVNQFIESAARFSEKQAEKADLKMFVERLLLQDSQDKRDEEDEDDDVRKNEVTLMTLHSSKGLEFNTVFLVGMEEELLPHKKTVKQGEDVSEERRLCYVGITRAQKKLYMTYCKERKLYGAKTPRYPSRFIFELDKEDLLQIQDRTNFGHMSKDEAEEYKSDFFKGLMNLLDE
ncbi:UvrD-helicase domain-containing protein [Halobacteriovorax sp. GB3]|uniref:ATP-dependent helicase n=1 Tax=Halobacteriovorax sp. GB3 TaxID=2719615 RepID=UPI00236195EA|nr:UvrD-helicase domain-containing protein [Halobacteriovorax sp. GB3]MDD0853326.1 UvrD-helicase domain-containing protein [Halobacteriovorax sp. GB3]